MLDIADTFIYYTKGYCKKSGVKDYCALSLFAFTGSKTSSDMSSILLYKVLKVQRGINPKRKPRSS